MKEYFIIWETDKAPYVVEYVTEPETERGGKKFIDFIHSHIDGVFEIKSTMNEMSILCDEEGLLKKFPINLISRYLYGKTIVRNTVISKHNYYQGTLDIVGFDDKEDAERRCIAMKKVWETLRGEF